MDHKDKVPDSVPANFSVQSLDLDHKKSDVYEAFKTSRERVHKLLDSAGGVSVIKHDLSKAVDNVWNGSEDLNTRILSLIVVGRTIQGEKFNKPTGIGFGKLEVGEDGKISKDQLGNIPKEVKDMLKDFLKDLEEE